MVVEPDAMGGADMADYLRASVADAVSLPVGLSAADLDVALARFDLSGVVTFSESLLPLADALAVRRGVLSNGAETTLALTDKSHQRRLLRAAGVPTPAVGLLDDVARWSALRERLAGPVVLKPARGFASAHTHFLDRGDHSLPPDVIEQLQAGRRVVVEEYLQGVPRRPLGDYVSVESVVSRGVVRNLGITDKLPLVPPFRETSVSIFETASVTTSVTESSAAFV